MEILSCPFLMGEVELTDTRERHIAEQHPELLPENKGYLARVLADPDEIRRSSHVGNAMLFSRWFPGLRGGKHVVVVVLSDLSESKRHWIVTAYMARRLVEGERVWKRS